MTARGLRTLLRRRLPAAGQRVPRPADRRHAPSRPSSATTPPSAPSFVRPFLAGAGLQTMLDIGGSTGVVAQHFAREFGLRRHADRSGAARGRAGAARSGSRRSPGWSRSTTSAPAASTSSSSARRSITCSTSPARCARVRELLTERGLLFVDIVDFRAAYLRNWSVEDAVKIDHPYYLTEATMAAYLRRAGFEVAARGLRRRPPARQLRVPARRRRSRTRCRRRRRSRRCSARSGSCRTRPAER